MFWGIEGLTATRKRIRRLWARWVAVRLISVNWNEMWAHWMERRKKWRRFQWNGNKNFSHSFWPRAHRNSNSNFTTRQRYARWQHLSTLRFDRRMQLIERKKSKEITIARRWHWWDMRIRPQTELWYIVIRWPLATPLFTLNFLFHFSRWNPFYWFTINI